MYRRILGIFAGHGVMAVFICGLIVIGAGFLLFRQDARQSRVRFSLFQQVSSVSAAAADNGQGFFETRGFGWASVNCINDWNGDGIVDPGAEDQCGGGAGAYGLNVEMVGWDGAINGFAWSPNAGLICFGADACGADRAPDGSIPQATFQFDEGGITPVLGWARALAHANAGGDNSGWIRLNGTTAAGAPIEVIARVEGEGASSYLAFTGSGWQRNPDGTGAGWVDFNIRTRAETGAVPVGVEPRPGHEVDCGAGGAACCSNVRDDDDDQNYNRGDLDGAVPAARDRNPISGVDCLDYDCAGLRFYSNTYNPEGEFAYEHCGQIPAAGNNENSLSAGDCFDGFDNDLDGIFDCADPDCKDAINPEDALERCIAAERIPDRLSLCSDGEDNEGDGAADCGDADCREVPVCVPDNLQSGHAQCPGICRNNNPDDPAFCLDEDSDLVCDYVEGRAVDNCPGLYNPAQADADDNGIGDLCDAFLQTTQGALYSRGFQAPAPAPVPNATFCLLSSGLVRNFNSADEQCEITLDERVHELRLLQYADSVVLWSRALNGIIDLNGLRLGKYGRVKATSAGQESLALDEIGNTASVFKVIRHRGDFILDQAVTVPTGKGPVTVIVEGDFRINSGAALTYAPSVSGFDRSALSSVAWIVIDPDLDDNKAQGNIIIDGTVQTLSGAFFASGQVNTGTQGGAFDSPITIRGLMVARKFTFARKSIKGNARASELIIYDGRVLLNPPPGTADIAKTLPIFRSIAPQ